MLPSRPDLYERHRVLPPPALLSGPRAHQGVAALARRGQVLPEDGLAQAIPRPADRVEREVRRSQIKNTRDRMM